jgi:hypothetical protein
MKLRQLIWGREDRREIFKYRYQAKFRGLKAPVFKAFRDRFGKTWTLAPLFPCPHQYYTGFESLEACKQKAPELLEQFIDTVQLCQAKSKNSSAG